MIYLTFEEYSAIGGVLDLTAFNRNIDRVCGIVKNATFGRVDAMTEAPREVKACCRELVEFLGNISEKGNVSSQSQSAGGVSESISYAIKTAEDVENECANILFDFLGSVKNENGTPLLYRGAMD